MILALPKVQHMFMQQWATLKKNNSKETSTFHTHMGNKSKLPRVKLNFKPMMAISGTPKYWKKYKYEFLAKLDNLGPF